MGTWDQLVRARYKGDIPSFYCCASPSPLLYFPLCQTRSVMFPCSNGNTCADTYHSWSPSLGCFIRSNPGAMSRGGRKDYRSFIYTCAVLVTSIPRPNLIQPLAKWQIISGAAQNRRLEIDTGVPWSASIMRDFLDAGGAKNCDRKRQICQTSASQPN
jgi:hypothetical protein